MAKHFFHALKDGQQGEGMVVDLFTMHGYTAKKNEGDKNSKSVYDYEFTKNNESLTVEVKTDIYAARSGNIAIEYYNPKAGKASGVTISQADYWIHLLLNPTKFLVARLSHLRDFIDSVPPLKIVKRCGDGNAAIFLYEISTIECCFTDITNVENLESTLKKI